MSSDCQCLYTQGRYGKINPMTVKENKHVRWIDIEGPKAADLAFLKKELGIHPIILEELKGPSARAHVDAYRDYLFFIYYFPLYDTADGSSVRTEIDFIVTKDTVATVHYESLAKPLDGLTVKSEKSSLELVYRIISQLIVFEERELRHIREKAEQVGHDIFKDKEREVLERLTYLKRDISEYRIVEGLQRPILESLRTHGRKFWGGDADVYLNDLIGDHVRVMSQLEAYRSAVSDFEDTNNQLMNLKVNNVMKTFTTLSFLTFPFVLIATLFTMRVPGVPLENQPGAFWIIVLGIALCMLALTVYFKFKKWF